MSVADKGRVRILLLAGDVRSNLGDRAIRRALCDLIRQLAPEAELYAFSRTPERDRREFGVRVLGRSPLGLVTGVARLRDFTFATWGGGQLLQDDSSKVKNVYWALVLFWVRRVLRLPVAGLSLGVGPLRTGWGRWWAAAALRQLDTLIARDHRSAEEARRLTGGRTLVREAPDLAWFLPAVEESDRDRYFASVENVPLAPGELVVGVALRRWFHLRDNWLPDAWRPARGALAGNPRLEELLQHVADALRMWAAGRPVRVLFFPMAAGAGEGDAELSRRVGEWSGLRWHVLRLQADAAMARAMAGRCDLFVSMRMHSALLALSMGVPTLALYHVPKVRDLLAGIGLPAQAMAVEEVAAADGAAKVAERMRATEQQREAIREAVRRAAAEIRSRAGAYVETLGHMMEAGLQRAARAEREARRPETLRG